MRTELGLAYSAGSLWTAPAETDGIVGALTRTKSESTVAAVRAILEVMEEMRESPPTEDEVSTAVDAASNGFGFNFQSPTQIVSRLMLFRARDLPDDWLERYVDRIQGVSPVDVRDVLRRHLHPERMTILLLGDPSAFDEPPEALGDVTIWEVEGLADAPPPRRDPSARVTPGRSPSNGATSISRRRGWPRFPGSEGSNEPHGIPRLASDQREALDPGSHGPRRAGSCTPKDAPTRFGPRPEVRG